MGRGRVITPAWAEHRELVVVGAGPAGMTAAALAAGLGVDTLLLDDQPEPGGQIWRGTGRSPARAELLGEDYQRGADRVQALRTSGAEHRPGCVVFDIDDEGVVHVADGAGGYGVQAKRIILATGALERPFPIPGWTLPGVMMAGGAQGLLKTAGLVPEGRDDDGDGLSDGEFVLAGTGPLLYLLAWQYLRAGVRPRALLDTTPLGNYRRALAYLPGALGAGGQLGKGLGWLRALRAQGVRWIAGVRDLRAVGDGRVEAVEFRRRDKLQRVDTPLLMLHQGVVPHVNLPLAVGCRHYWDDRQLCFRPVLDDRGLSSRPDIAIAGDGAGIAGAQAATAAGALAGLDAAHACGRLSAADRERLARPHLRERDRLHRGRAFLEVLYRPHDHHRVPVEDEVIVCRCEEVRAGRLRTLANQGLRSADSLKQRARCGMGPCQGRHCALTVTELLANIHGLEPREVGSFHIRPPVRPVPATTLMAFDRGAPPEANLAVSYRGTDQA